MERIILEIIVVILNTAIQQTDSNLVSGRALIAQDTRNILTKKDFINHVSQQSSAFDQLDTYPILRSFEFTNNIALRLDNRTELLESYQDILSIAHKIEGLI